LLYLNFAIESDESLLPHYFLLNVPSIKIFIEVSSLVYSALFD